MAFNPFNVFRRNQKILFAILTVFIMFMFTLSFGANDFFSLIPTWLRSKNRGGEVLALVNGSKVTAGDLEYININRQMANQYMFSAGAAAITKLESQIQEGMSRVSTDNRPTVQQALQTHRIMMAFGQRQAITPEMLGMMEQNFGLNLGRTLFDLNRLNAGGPGVKDDDIPVARNALQLLELDFRLFSGGRGLYFTNQPNRLRSERLDFYMWLKKADQLGVTFTTKDVDALVAGEFGVQLTNEDLRPAVADLKNSQRYTPEALTDALRDEYRVRAAQLALMGQQYARTPALLARGFASPYSYFEFFKDQASPARFGVVTVPAENYLAKVTEEPKESELRKIFESFRGQEPVPMLARPGLKEPRKLKLEWIEVKGDEEFYKKAAAEALPKIEAQAKLSAALTFPLGGAGWLVVASPTVAGLPDPALQAAYADFTKKANERTERNWFDLTRFSDPRPIDGNVFRPQNLAIAAGSAAGSLITGAPAFVAAIALEESAATFDRRGRASALAALLAPPLSLADSLGSLADVLARLPQPLPLAAVRAQLIETAKEDLAFRIAQADIKKFQEDMAKLGEKADKHAEAKALAAKFVADRKLKHGESTAFHDQYTMGDDPGLAELKEKLTGPHGMSASLIQFGRRFFFESPKPGAPEGPATAMFKPQPYPNPELDGPSKIGSAYLVWRTAEIPSETPRAFTDKGVKEKAEAAWRRQKARELAKQAADALAKECDGKLGATRGQIVQNLFDKRIQLENQFMNPEARARVQYFELRDVAPLLVQPSFGPNRYTAMPWQLTPSTNIQFPTLKMQDELMTARQKPLSTTVVLNDSPEDKYFVAVLMEKDEQSPEFFTEQVYAPLVGMSEVSRTVDQRYQGELRKEAYSQAVGLLKAEFNFEQKVADLDAKTDGIDE